MPTLALNLTDYWLTILRRTWRGSLVSSFVTPLLYVVSMGVLLGNYVSAGPSRLEGASSYLAFIAPGLVSAQAMTTMFSEMTYPVMGMIKWQRVYHSMIATPLRVRDIVASQLVFALLRVFVICGVFLLVLGCFGVLDSIGGSVVAAFAQILVAGAFAAPLLAFSATLKDESAYSILFRLGMIPMFLFSGAFFPVSNLSAPLEFLARLTPLWHGVDLTRMLVLGHVDALSALVHVVYLGAFLAVGWWLAVRQLERRLIA